MFQRRGLPETTVFVLPVGSTIEDLVDERRYLAGVNEELRRSHGPTVGIASPLPTRGRVRSVTAYCKEKEISIPSRYKVAAHIVADRSNGLVRTEDRDELCKLVERIRVTLGLA